MFTITKAQTQNAASVYLKDREYYFENLLSLKFSFLTKYLIFEILHFKEEPRIFKSKI